MDVTEGLSLKRLDESMLEEPINKKLTEDDFYKFSMGQVLFDNSEYGEKITEWDFTCRTNIRLADYITEEDFMREYAHVMMLRATKSEFHYLHGTYEYDVRMFSEDYLTMLSNLQIPPATFEVTNEGGIKIRVRGSWNHSKHAEMPVLKIINTLFYRAQLKKMSKLEREVIYAEGIKRLAQTIKLLKTRPNLKFSDFGNRRAFGPLWHEYVVVRCAEELPNQFIGTSNVALAAKYDLAPIGTCAHEMSMGITAVHFDGTKDSIIFALRRLHEIWWKAYGHGLSVGLPDTYGTTWTFSVLPEEVLREWKGWRIDSKDPKVAIAEMLTMYKHLGVDATQKLAIPSDGLTPELMIEIFDLFNEAIKLSFGFGTHLTNNMGLQTLSIVMKLRIIVVDGKEKSCVKISDNRAKARGDDKDLYIEVIGDTNDTYVPQVV